MALKSLYVEKKLCVGILNIRHLEQKLLSQKISFKTSFTSQIVRKKIVTEFVHVFWEHDNTRCAKLVFRLKSFSIAVVYAVVLLSIALEKRKKLAISETY